MKKGIRTRQRAHVSLESSRQVPLNPAIGKGVSFMSGGFKVLARELLPKRYQVPAKYWYGWLVGTLEAELELLALILRNQDRVIDVGGNRGMYTYHFWKIGAKVEVFEPNPACSRILSAWATGRPDMNIHSVALSSCAGSAHLHIPVDKSGIEHDASASIENTGFAHARDLSVSLQTLDSYQFEGVQLIKIDVEGHECSVIEGAATTITSSKPALLVEIEQRHNNRPIAEVFRKILGFGYRGFFLGSEGLTPLENFDVSIHQSMDNFDRPKRQYINNFLFLHDSRLANGRYDGLIKERGRLRT